MTAVTVHHVVTGPEDAPVVVLSNSLGSTHRSGRHRRRGETVDDDFVLDAALEIVVTPLATHPSDVNA